MKLKELKKMNIPTIEGTFEYNLKQAVSIMIDDDPEYQDMTVDEAINKIQMGGETLEDYIETRPTQFGQAMAAVVFDYLGSDKLSDIVRG
jgi:hypothetical protein